MKKKSCLLDLLYQSNVPSYSLWRSCYNILFIFWDFVQETFYIVQCLDKVLIFLICSTCFDFQEDFFHQTKKDILWLLEKYVNLNRVYYNKVSNFIWATFLLQYFLYSCILGLMSCSVFLRVNYELKMLLMLIAVVVYNVILLQTHASLFDDYSRMLYTTVQIDRYILYGALYNCALFFLLAIITKPLNHRHYSI